jgi:hypothetical protein
MQLSSNLMCKSDTLLDNDTEAMSKWDSITNKPRVDIFAALNVLGLPNSNLSITTSTLGMTDIERLTKIRRRKEVATGRMSSMVSTSTATTTTTTTTEDGDE